MRCKVPSLFVGPLAMGAFSICSSRIWTWGISPLSCVCSLTYPSTLLLVSRVVFLCSEISCTCALLTIAIIADNRLAGGRETRRLSPISAAYS